MVMVWGRAQGLGSDSELLPDADAVRVAVFGANRSWPAGDVPLAPLAEQSQDRYVKGTKPLVTLNTAWPRC